jgi:DNA-binding winged helix-turn-helix (wHTH) protein
MEIVDSKETIQSLTREKERLERLLGESTARQETLEQQVQETRRALEDVSKIEQVVEENKILR